MDRALVVLAGGALLVVLVEAGAGDAGPAALTVPLACAFAVLSVLGYRWAQARGRGAWIASSASSRSASCSSTWPAPG